MSSGRAARGPSHWGGSGTLPSTWGLENFRGWALRIWPDRFPDHERVFVATWSNTIVKRHRCRKNPISGRGNGQTIFAKPIGGIFLDPHSEPSGWLLLDPRLLNNVTHIGDCQFSSISAVSTGLMNVTAPPQSQSSRNSVQDRTVLEMFWSV